jgi:DNA replication protein DnaC
MSDARLEKYARAGRVDLTDPERPFALPKCSGCGVGWRAPLFLEDGTIVVSPLRWLMVAECDECAAKADAEAARREAERWIGVSGIPRALAAEVSWETIITSASSPDDQAKRERALELARGWAEDSSMGAKGVWLHGSQGSGKTRLIATAAVAKMAHVPVRWVSVAVLIAQLDGAWADDDRKAALKVLTDPGIVVLDDLDKVKPTDRVQLALFTALEAREQAKVGICVTSNEPPSKVGEMFSSPFMSRLISMATPLAYPGPDRRLHLVG